MKPHHVSSKLVLLTQAFPALRIIWSQSPHHSAAVLEALKEGHVEPLDTAEGLKPHHASVNEDQEQAEQLEQFDSIDVLKRLPGVNSHNVRALAQAAENMRGLAKLSKLDLQKLTGKSNGAELFSFLHESLFSHSSTSSNKRD